MVEKKNNKALGNKVGIVGIVANTLLCSLKLFIGYLTNSISIISDGYNNFSDIGNAIFIYLGYRLTNKPADKEHPFGHGRFEYMISQGISIMIIIVGISLLRSSIDRLINPQPLNYNPYAFLILIFSVLLKIGLAYYYTKLYKQTGLSTLKAQITDSLSDVAGTTVIIIAYLIMPLTSFPIDAIVGIILSFIIIYNGLEIFIRMTSVLLGKTVDEEVYHKITDILDNIEGIQGYHDLYLHSYGSDNIYGSCDVEIDSLLSFIDAHNICETAELKILDATGVRMTVHGDPIDNSKQAQKYKYMLYSLLDKLDEEISFHDFHNIGNRYFVDIVIPYDSKYTENYLIDLVRKELNNINIEVNIDRE